jgi:hypothetical protein
MLLLFLLHTTLALARASDPAYPALAARQGEVDPFPPMATAEPIVAFCDARSVVTSCSDNDFKQLNWAAFQVAAYLEDYITQVRLGSNLARQFVGNLVFTSTFVAFNCGTASSGADCVHPTTSNPDVSTDWAFFGLMPTHAESQCAKSFAPQAAFIVENDIR